MEQPIACTLSADDYAARAQDTGELARRALRSRQPISDGARLIFDADPQTERDLRELIAAEARCCAFLRMKLTSQAESLILEVTGPADAQPIIAELFA